MTNVNSFFRTKLAQAKNEDRIIDPGEAAAGGLAILSSPISKYVVPTALKTLLSKTYEKSQKWGGEPVYNLKHIGGSDIPKKILEEYARNIKAQQGVNVPLDLLRSTLQFEGKALNKQKILGGLFEAFPKQVGSAGYIFEPENLSKLNEIQKSVNSMLDKYNLPEKGVTLSLRSGPLSKTYGPHYNPAIKEIVLPKLSKDIALHEIGHAAHFTRKGAGAANVLRKTLLRGSILAAPMAYIAGDEIQKMFPGKIDDKIVDFVQKHSPAIIASTYAGASLYPEVQATARAISHVYKTEGAAAAKKSARVLFPYLLSYTIPLVPAMVGIGLARKWHKEAKENQKKLEKMAGVVSKMVDFANELRTHTGHLLKQIGPQAGDILEKPMNDFMETMYRSGKNVIKSPEFAAGAATVGIPTALISYVKLNTPHGKALTERRRELGIGEKWIKHGKGSPGAEIPYQLEKAKQDSVTPAIIGITSAISAGFLTKLFSDLGRVM